MDEPRWEPQPIERRRLTRTTEERTGKHLAALKPGPVNFTVASSSLRKDFDPQKDSDPRVENLKQLDKQLDEPMQRPPASCALKNKGQQNLTVLIRERLSPPRAYQGD